MKFYRFIKKGIVKIGVVDIETTDLDASMNHVLTFVMDVYDLRTKKRKRYYDYFTKTDLNKTMRGRCVTFDKRMLKNFLKIIKDEKINMLVGHYSTWFDFPFLRTRCFINKLKFPTYRQLRFFDNWKFSRKGFRTRNNLETMSYVLRTRENKTKISRRYWLRARHADKAAIRYILRHNKLDVEMTYQNFLKIVDYIQVTNQYI